jgi:XTP/dITP diphosphohydrolase
MRKFIVATRNKGKLKEIKEILAGMSYEVITMEEAGFDKEIEETGQTFEENALLKAQKVYEALGEIVMADDSGLEVDYLNGAPGIYSSRFAGENASDAERIDKLLKMLEGVEIKDRKARFVCSIAVVFSDDLSFVVRGTCEGYIAFKPEGDNGFGYDPVFYIPEYGKTMAQLDSEEKNRISHRGRALNLMLEELKRMEEKCENSGHQ